MLTAHAEALEAFNSDKVITPPLRELLQEMATTGQSSIDWDHLKEIIAAQILAVCTEYYEVTKDLESTGETYDSVLKRIFTLLKDFPNAPFTTQRLCELLLDPHRIYYTSTRKLMHAVEKLLTVSSTVPTMQLASAKPGSYQAAAGYELGKLASGEVGNDAMDVET